MFQKVNNMDRLKGNIAKAELAFVYFGHPECSVCHGLKPQINSKLAEFSDDVSFYEVNTFEMPEVAGEYSIMTVPVILLFVNGKEYLRQGRFVPINQLYEQVSKIVSGYKNSEK